MPLDHALRDALSAIDQALAEKPEGDGALFSAAALHLSAARDAIATDQRAHGATPDSRRRLEHVNAVISIVLACRFPLGAIPWDELEKGRAWLNDLADSCKEAPTP
jgi:hypothetical protein